MTQRELILQSLSVGSLQGKIKRTELVELSVPNATIGRATFTDQPQLRDQSNQIIIIQNVECFAVTAYANSQVNNAVAGFPSGDMPKGVLVLYVNGEESVRMIPLVKLNHIDDGGTTPFQRDLQGFDMLSNVDWDKSFVQFSSATSGATVVLPFLVTYLRFMVDPMDSQRWIER